MMRTLKRFLAAGAATAFMVAGLTLGGATSASAAGSCSYFAKQAGELVGTCTGTVYFNWTCSSDAFNTWNKKKMVYGSTASTKRIVGCNLGGVNDYYVSS
ncbi:MULTISPECIES: hypothetical protein [Curtobacterium]|jgi:hypothetical protein|uniref:Uncharacterized protein n=1 Tax=Curtobacterium aurantiacum TaxID=3236919 RepID=A0ABS5VJJ1_9MICO|nr:MULTISPECIES: hypothetical protein [Curtobacterium]MBF4598167.1 hypothetical protein [Curtobacterium sp. VKM Ac-1796]MBF4610262.1 hypothetical protein [Curtobacterium sp. VKM Ac-2889]MBT1546026.1 hypothetical protein [Curtobacterium flaccumfaciens pv. flaccumfaciens]MBT1588182.1 hypothetical protein [Curtobacterium flaccumfaciens pv. flaccumfaciens]MBT1679758.1 hypothetical protein [Curtobacterium flaccumfaciens pv. flaccumfaciens]